MTLDELSDRVGFDVSRETFERLQTYHDLLIDWSRTHNLIGPRERDQLWTRHIADCLQIWPMVEGSERILDIGSGAGLPGLVLACAAADTGKTQLILVEPNGKRCAFLRHVTHKLKLPVRILNDKIENVSRETVEVITARAVADLPKLIEMSADWLENGAKALFLKGERYQDELTEAGRYWHFKAELTTSQSDSGGVVIVLTEVRPRHE